MSKINNIINPFEKYRNPINNAIVLRFVNKRGGRSVSVDTYNKSIIRHKFPDTNGRSMVLKEVTDEANNIKRSVIRTSTDKMDRITIDKTPKRKRVVEHNSEKSITSQILPDKSYSYKIFDKFYGPEDPIVIREVTKTVKDGKTTLMVKTPYKEKYYEYEGDKMVLREILNKKDSSNSSYAIYRPSKLEVAWSKIKNFFGIKSNVNSSDKLVKYTKNGETIAEARNGSTTIYAYNKLDDISIERLRRDSM